MKSIDKNDFLPIGFVQKSHGNHGEIKISLSSPQKIKEWVFIEFNQKPVPFFIEKQSGNSKCLILKLKGINSVQDTDLLVNKKVLYPKKLLKKSKEIDLYITGFSIVDKQVGYIGNVESVLLQTPQPLIQTTYQSSELLIPGIEPILKMIDIDNNLVEVELPAGFIDLYKQ